MSNHETLVCAQIVLYTAYVLLGISIMVCLTKVLIQVIKSPTNQSLIFLLLAFIILGDFCYIAQQQCFVFAL